MTHTFRSADTVFHNPSGEKWVLAYGDAEHVSPCGWPGGRADAKDCTLIKAGTDLEYVQMVLNWRMRTPGDYRTEKCKAIRLPGEEVMA